MGGDRQTDRQTEPKYMGSDRVTDSLTQETDKVTQEIRKRTKREEKGRQRQCFLGTQTRAEESFR